MAQKRYRESQKRKMADTEDQVAELTARLNALATEKVRPEGICCAGTGQACSALSGLRQGPTNRCSFSIWWICKSLTHFRTAADPKSASVTQTRLRPLTQPK